MIDNKKYLIIYHNEDNDGCCSAAILKHYLMTSLGVSEDNIGLFPANYAILDKVAANNFTEISGYDSVILTDISFNNFDYMEMLFEMFGKDNFTWIDHHAPVIKMSEERKYDIKMNGVRDTSRSAILNAYKYCYDNFDILYNGGEAPLILRYLSAIDSWSYEHEGLDFDTCRHINTGFTKTSKLEVSWWMERIEDILANSKEYVDNILDEMYTLGKKINDEADERNEKFVKHAGIGDFTVNGNRKCIIVFTSGPTSSLIFKSVKGVYDNAVCFKTSSAGKILISMYNVTDDSSFHCGTYLHDKYGGGGHEGAAGATIDFETFINILQTKQI
jgi:oligoribonuclease NrnB/cAMP/cGMP phosphodiesterase (DHH superfamily)